MARNFSFSWEPGPFPLRRSGRILRQANEAPWLMRGDAGWCAATQLNLSELRQYLADRAGRGVNCTNLEIIERKFNTNANPGLGTNRNGDTPFTGTVGAFGSPDFSTPNSNYWSWIDTVFAEHRAVGIEPIRFPMYLGSHADSRSLNQGWYFQLNDNGSARAQSYGTFLGNRYPGGLWCMGGDLGSTSTPQNLDATTYQLLVDFTAAFRAANPTAVITGHFDGAGRTRNEPTQGTHGRGDWEDLDAVYVESVLTTDTLAAYNASPIIPAFTIETTYYGNTSAGLSLAQLRSQAWQSYLSGGMGYIGGNESVWSFNAPWTFNDGAGWTTHLADAHLTHTATVCGGAFASRNWRILVPDSGSAFVTAGRGTPGTIGYVPAAIASDGSWGGLYVLNAGSVTLAFSGFNGTKTYKAIDPSNGAVTVLGTHANSGSVTLNTSTFGTTADGGSDWFLVSE